MRRKNSKIISVIDVGTTKIVCFIAKYNVTLDVLEVIGIGHCKSSGLKGGKILNASELIESIIQSIEKAEKMSGIPIKSAYINISSLVLISDLATAEIVVTGHEIGQKDIVKLNNQIRDRYTSQKQLVVDAWELSYNIDRCDDIESPLSLYGDQLLGCFHVLAAAENDLKNIDSYIDKCDLKIDGYIPSAYASALSCISDDEMERGTIFIEFGGGSTSISIFKNGTMISTDAIEMGGDLITQDIANTIGASTQCAERLKVLYGAASSLGSQSPNIINQKIEIPTLDSQPEKTRYIERKLLIDIIEARLEEILESLQRKINIEKLKIFEVHQVVLTGGGSQLPHISEFVQKFFNKHTRVARPKIFKGLADSTSGVAFANAIGMLCYASEIELESCNADDNWGGIVSWIQKTFS